MAFCVFGEAPTQVRNHAGLVACELSTDHPAFFDIDMCAIARSSSRSGSAARSDLLWSVDKPNWFSPGAVISLKTHCSHERAVLTRAGYMRAIPRRMSTYVATRPAAGAATTAPVRAKELATFFGCGLKTALSIRSGGGGGVF